MFFAANLVSQFLVETNDSALCVQMNFNSAQTGNVFFQCLQQLRAEQALAGDPASWNDLQKQIDELERRLAETLVLRKEASRQLRLLGISPKEQAHLLAEIERRLSA